MFFFCYSSLAQNKGQLRILVQAGDNNAALAGVSISASEIGTGTLHSGISDSSGIWVFSHLKEGGLYNISISHVGYEDHVTKNLKLKPGQLNSLVVRMTSTAKSLEELVVVGYSYQKKSDLTGAVSTLKGEERATTSNISVGSALQGKMSGMSILSSSGFPGANTSINIRGVGTFGTGDNAPLIVIDGVPVQGGFETLNPADISTVNVLKDASSAAIYGSRAANGVVLITTKKGKKGASAANFTVTSGTQQASHIPTLLRADEFVGIIQEMAANKKLIDGGNPVTKYDGADAKSYGEGTQWSDYIYRKAQTTDILASFSNGTEKTNYYISGEYLNQKGIGINTAYSKATLRSNISTTVFNRLTITSNTHLAYQVYKGDMSNRLSDVIFNAPVIPAYDEDGTFGEAPPQTSSKNAIAEVSWQTPAESRYRILQNVSLEYKILDALKFKLNAAADMTQSDYKLFSPLYSDGGQTNNQNSLTNKKSKDFMWLTDYLLYFNKKLNKHAIDAFAGFSKQLYTTDNISGTVRDFVSESENNQVINGSTNSQNITLTGMRNELALASYFGRVDYNYDNKYLASVNLRSDGSSRFKGNNQWGVFPSFAVGWSISNEDFFKVSFIDRLKLRASWGQLGNQSIGTWYPTSAPLTSQKVILGPGGNSQSLLYGYSQVNLGNNNLKWETTQISNAGIELGVLKNKLGLSVDYYIKRTSGILRTMVLPLSVGMGAPNVNYASVSNRGLDVEITYNEKWGDFSFAASANASFVRNKIEKLSEGNAEILSAPYGGVLINRVNDPITALFGYKTAGVITTKEEADKQKGMGQGNAKIGRLRYMDTDNDGKINADDRVILGSYIPKATTGLTFTLRYKNLDCNMVFIGVFGRKQHSPMSFQNRFPNRNATRKWYDNRWIPGQDPTGKYPAFIQSESYEEMTDLMVSNTSFAKWKQLNVGYNIKFAKTALRIYVAGENILTVTSKAFDGFDPENGNTYGHYTNWGGDYPTARILMAGFSFNF